MATYHKWFAGLIWATILAVIGFFWFSAFRFSYNFPYYDDFQNIIQFIYNYIKADSAWVRLTLLFQQNFEHRVLFSKLLTLTQYFLTGQINIQWLIFLGNLSLLGTLILFFQYLVKKQLSLLALFSITCLLFQVQHYEDTISWATCSLQHAPCLFFSLWSFYLALNRRNVFLSGALALLALFTSANGLSTIGLWLVIVFFMSQDRRKIAIPALIIISITLFHLATLTIHSGSLVTHVTSNVGPKFLLLLSFAGQLADPNVFGNIGPSVVLGVIFLAPLLIVLVKLFQRKYSQISMIQWFCAAGIITLLFVAFLIVFGRGVDADYDGYKMDRYKIYAAFFAALAVAFYDGYWSAFKRADLVRFVFAGASFLFCIGSYYLYYGSIVNYRKTIEANQYNYLWSKTIYYPVIYADPQTPVYMEFARKNFFKENNTLMFSGVDWKAVKDSITVKTTDAGGYFNLSNPDWKDYEGASEVLYAVAVNHLTAQPKYLFAIDNNYQRAFKQFYTTFVRPASQGFSCVIYKKELVKGSYDVYLITIKKGQVARAFKLNSIIV